MEAIKVMKAGLPVSCEMLKINLGTVLAYTLMVMNNDLSTRDYVSFLIEIYNYGNKVLSATENSTFDFQKRSK